MQSGNALRLPRLRTIESRDGERHASWLELFFDLVFVLAVAQVSKTLDHDLTLGGFLRYVALFAPVWWAWVGYSFYADRFESEDLTYRAMMFTGMLTVAALAVNINEAFNSDGTAYAVSYVAVRAVLIALYLRAWRHVPVARDLCTRYIVGFSIGASLWLASLLVAQPARYWLWGAGLLVELLTPLVSSSLVKRTPFDSSHIPERFGLFTIIVLGEAVILAASGVAETDWRASSALAAVIGFAVAAALWWSYFELVETCGLRKNWIVAGQTYVYGHFPVVVGIIAAGVGSQQAIAEAGSGYLSAGARWVLCGGLALYLVAISLIHLAAGRMNLIWMRLGTAAVMLTLAGIGGLISSLVLLSLLLFALVAEVYLEASRDLSANAACVQEEESMTDKCMHLGQVHQVTPSAEGCEECLKMGDTWVHLRLCLYCGHVGCGDNSKNKHATKHFGGTQHAIIRSFEPGEDWRWCYVDEIFL